RVLLISLPARRSSELCEARTCRSGADCRCHVPSGGSVFPGNYRVRTRRSGYQCRRRSGRHPGWLLSRVWGCFPTTCGFVLGPWFRRVLPCLLLFWRSVVLLCLVVRGRRSSQTRPGLVLLVRCGWLWVVSQCSLSEPPN